MNKLLISSDNIENLKSAIVKYFYDSTITLNQIKENQWNVSNSKGPLTNYIIIQKKNRFRFELINTNK